MVVFQVAYGAIVFALTREYYVSQAPAASPPRPAAVSSGKMVSKPWEAWSNTAGQAGGSALQPLSLGQAPMDDPAAVSAQADQYFHAKEYVMAATLYQQILEAGHEDVNTYNSLGITLHYLGRSDEALLALQKGRALEPGYQRIWLTTGFVNAQLGRFEEARQALQQAIALGPDTDVGQSAADMLGKLPQG